MIKISQIFQLVVFLFCLVAPLGSLFFYMEEKPWGNIPLPDSIVDQEDLELGNYHLLKSFLFSTKFRESLLSNSLKHSFLKRKAFHLKHELLYKYSSVDHERIRSGKDGYLFLKDQFKSRHCGEMPNSYLGLESVGFLLDWAEVLGFQLKIVVPPNKGSLHIEKLSSYADSTIDCYTEIGEKVRDAASKFYPDRITFHHGLMEKLKVHSIPPYTKLDTHWTNLAGYLSLLDINDQFPEIAEIPSLSRMKDRKADMGNLMLMLNKTIPEQFPTNDALKRFENTPFADENWMVMHDSFYAKIKSYVLKNFPESLMIPYSKLEKHESDFKNYDNFFFSIVERNFPNFLHREVIARGSFFSHLENVAMQLSNKCKFSLEVDSFDGENGIYAYDLQRLDSGEFKRAGAFAGILLKGKNLAEYNCVEFDIEVPRPTKLEFRYLPNISKAYYSKPKFRLKHLVKKLDKGSNRISIVLPRLSELKMDVLGQGNFELGSFSLGKLPS